MSQSAEEDLSSLGRPLSTEDAEQRSATRYTPLIRTAKIRCARGEFLCVVSDVSTTGVSLRLFHPLPADSALDLEMPNGESLPIEPVWKEEGRAGFRFAAEVDLHRLLQGHGKWPKRPIRLNLEMPARLAGLTGRYEATIRNISLQGAQIECDAHLAIDQRLRLSSDSLPEIVTKVRWRDGKLYGLIFDDTFQFADLARIAAEVQGIG
ncbi:PilZ domain-containing protein [Altererythrobacter soli]|uniref:PilZ domain-containing protein n=1 Tax=Croceibacterium soli TaxID=1739690 RepID=A0A6I4URH1_9SPHN|nr:PilZ domain-containing protein [Croceibacterium soli]MXP40344.1 PilZ domain-containing protein [Croceibacterium soli]